MFVRVSEIRSTEPLLAFEYILTEIIYKIHFIICIICIAAILYQL